MCNYEVEKESLTCPSGATTSVVPDLNWDMIAPSSLSPPAPVTYK